jgi:hypothetical protein
MRKGEKEGGERKEERYIHGKFVSTLLARVLTFPALGIGSAGVSVGASGLGTLVSIPQALLLGMPI